LPPLLLPTLLPTPPPTTIITPLIFFVLNHRWKNVQEASSSLQERVSGCEAEVGGKVWVAVHEGVVEGSVRPQPPSQKRS